MAQCNSALIGGQASVEPDPALMDRLATKYSGLHLHPRALRDSPDYVIVRVTIDRISGVGRWIEEERDVELEGAL